MWPKTVFFFYFHLQKLRKWALRAWISLSLSPSLLIIINAIISRWGWAVLIRALSMLPDVAAFISYTLTETLKNVSIKHSSSSLDLSLSFVKLHYSSLALTLFYCCFYFPPSGWFHWLKKLIGRDSCRRRLNELFRVMFGVMSLDNMISLVFKLIVWL